MNIGNITLNNNLLMISISEVRMFGLKYRVKKWSFFLLWALLISSIMGCL